MRLLSILYLSLFIGLNSCDFGAKSMNTPDKPINELKRLALGEGDIESYEKLETAYLDYKPEEFIPIAMEMADKYEHPRAFHDVYWKMYSAQGLSEEDEVSKWHEWQEQERRVSLRHLILGALNGCEESISTIDEYYTLLNPLNGLIARDSILKNEFYIELEELGIIYEIHFDPKESFEVSLFIKFIDSTSNIEETPRCLAWNLNEEQIKKVIKDSDPLADSDWHDFFGHMPCTVEGELVQNDFIFMFSVNAGSWISIWNGKSTHYHANFNKTNEELFISTHWTIEDMDHESEEME